MHLVIDATGFLLIMAGVVVISVLLDLSHAWVVFHSAVLLVAWLLSRETVTRQGHGSKDKFIGQQTGQVD